MDELLDDVGENFDDLSSTDITDDKASEYLHLIMRT